MGDMADWQIDNMLVPDDWEDREMQREWTKRENGLIKEAKLIKKETKPGGGNE